MQKREKLLCRAVTTTGAAGGSYITTFYCKIFTLKAKANFLLLRLKSTHNYYYFVTKYCSYNLFFREKKYRIVVMPKIFSSARLVTAF